MKINLLIIKRSKINIIILKCQNLLKQEIIYNVDHMIKNLILMFIK